MSGSKNSKINGFTLLEVLLAVAIISFMSLGSAFVYQGFYVRNNLNIATNTVGQSFRRAQLLSQAVEGDSRWGVRIEPGLIVIFKGSTYATRDTSKDEIFVLPGNVVPSGLNEVVYTRMYGEPLTTGTVTLTTPNDTSSITINSKGTVFYQ